MRASGDVAGGIGLAFLLGLLHGIGSGINGDCGIGGCNRRACGGGFGAGSRGLASRLRGHGGLVAGLVGCGGGLGLLLVHGGGVACGERERTGSEKEGKLGIH